MLKLLKNKYLLTAGAILVFGLTVALGILYAKDRVALNDILNEEEAVNFAYLDAGVSSDDVISYTAERDKALGEYVYRINFSSKDATYSYVVDANHGDIISGIKENTDNGNIAQNNNSDNNNPSISIHEETPEDTEKKTDRNGQKTDDKDKTKDNPKTENKSDTTENSGNTGSNETDKPSTTKTEDSTKSTATKKPDKTAGGGEESETSPDKPKKNKDKNKNKDKTSSGDKTETNTNTSSDTKRYISVDKAKTIALKQAGLTPATVTFGKAVLKKDDGKIIYEIEFFTSSHEYEYEIDAYSGTILSQDVDVLSPSEQTGKNIEQGSNTPKNEDLEKFKDDDDDDKDDGKDDDKDDDGKDDDD